MPIAKIGFKTILPLFLMVGIFSPPQALASKGLRVKKRKMITQKKQKAKRQFLGDFDVTQHSVPIKEILGGGVPKDGIPAIVKPKFVKVKEATFLKSQDIVLGVVQGKLAKAYPVKILNYHEVVNDRIGNTPIAVSY